MTRSPVLLSLGFLMAVLRPALTYDVQAQTGPDTPYATEIWHEADLGTNLGANGLRIADLDGDGRDEIIGTGNYSLYTSIDYHAGSRFFVLAGGDHDLAFVSPPYESSFDYWFGSYTAIRDLAIANADGDADQEIYVLRAQGKVEVYDGVSFARVDTFSLAMEDSARRLEILDIDHDGALEYLVLGSPVSFSSDERLAIYDAASRALEWDTTGVFQDMVIGDVDGDSLEEIVLASGVVLDGSSRARDWFYVDGFGRSIKLGQSDLDPALEIMAITHDERWVVFDSEFRTPLWEVDLPYTVGAYDVVDMDNDGAWEMVMDNMYSTSLYVYDARTGAASPELTKAAYAALTGLAHGDTDGDGDVELIWFQGDEYADGGLVSVFNWGSRNLSFLRQEFTGPFLVQTADQDGEDPLEITVAADRLLGARGEVRVLDGADHSSRWNSDETSRSSYYSLDALGLVDTDGDRIAELFLGDEYETRAYGGWPLEPRWRDGDLEGLRVFAAADVDADGTIELAYGNQAGKVTLVSGDTPAIEWMSITTPGEIGGIRLADVDDDSTLEVVFFNLNGRVRVYDGATHVLEWQSDAIDNATALDVVDMDRDGEKEVLIGRADGTVTVLAAGTFSEVATFVASSGPISGLRAGNVDDTEAPELVVADSTIRVLRWHDKQLLWESRAYGIGLGRRDGLHVVDIDVDGHMDILAAGFLDVVQLEVSVRYPDTTPPVVLAVTPPSITTRGSRDTPAEAVFSEPIDDSSLQAAIQVQADGADTPFEAAVSDDGRTVTIVPVDLWPASASIQVVIGGALADTSGNGLDGNRNGISEASPLDDYRFGFGTGAGVDTLGPVVVHLVLQSDSLWQGISIQGSVTISDSSEVAVSAVSGAEYFLDAVGDVGAGVQLAFPDSLVGYARTALTFVVETADLVGGSHTLFVRGKDTRDIWGPIKSIPFYLITPQGSEWAQFGQNAQHTGYNAADSITVPLVLAWQARINSQGISAPVVLNDRVVVSSTSYFEDAVVYTYDTHTGEKLWSYSFGSIFSLMMPALAYGRVYVQSSNHTPGSFITALDQETGTVVWQTPFETQWDIGLAPMVAEGNVYIGAGYYGGMKAYDAFSGEELWSVNLPQEFNWAPTYFGGTVYAGWSDASFFRFDATEGTARPVVGNPGYNAGTAVISDSLLYTLNPLVAIDLRDERELWRTSGGLMPAVAEGAVYAIHDGILRSLDAANGRLRWEIDGEPNLGYSPAVANGLVFASSESTTYAYDAVTGNEVWSYEAGGRLAIAGNRLYIASPSGTLYAFRIDDTVMITATEEVAESPAEFALEPNYPNPFNPTTVIPFVLPTESEVRLEIYNALGQRVSILADERRAAGRHEVTWEAGSFSSGTYFVRIEAGGFMDSRAILLVK